MIIIYSTGLNVTQLNNSVITYKLTYDHKKATQSISRSPSIIKCQ
jgi:hypothetical protein